MPSRVVTFSENDRDTISWSFFPVRSSSGPMQATPRSSRAVRMTMTLNHFRTCTGSTVARSHTVRTPYPPRRRSRRVAMPHTSETGSASISRCRHSGLVPGHTHTPSKTGIFFAVRFASFASVRVGAIPTHTGTPSRRRRVSLMSRPSLTIASTSPAVRRSIVRNASSME